MHIIILTTALWVALGSAAGAQEPPPTPPADWGPMSINLEDVPYPHPVSFMSFSLEGQDVRMAYMDVPPAGPGNAARMTSNSGRRSSDSSSSARLAMPARAFV